MLGVKWDTAGHILAVCDSTAAGASGKSAITLLNTSNGKTRRITSPEPITCAAFPPEYSWDGPQAVVLGTADGAILIAKESSTALFGQTGCHQLHKDTTSGRVWDVQLSGARVAWVTVAGVKLHDVDCNARLLVDKSPLQAQLGALVGEQIPPRLSWLAPEWLAAAWGNRVLVYSVAPTLTRPDGTAQPASVIRCADLHVDGFVVGMAPFGPSRLLVVHVELRESGSLGLRGTVWPRVFKGGKGGHPEVSEAFSLGDHPSSAEWLPGNFHVAFHSDLNLQPDYLGLGPDQAPAPSRAMSRIFLQTPAEVLQVQPRTVFDHVHWCDEHGMAEQALQVALTLPVPSPEAAVTLLQRDMAARFLTGRVQEALNNAPRLWLWACAPLTNQGDETRNKSFSLSAISGAFGGGSGGRANPQGLAAEQLHKSTRALLSSLTAWYLWLLGSVPLACKGWGVESTTPPSAQGLALAGDDLRDTLQLCTLAFGSVWCDGALLSPLLSRGAAAASGEKLPALVSRCLPSAKGRAGGRKNSQSSTARAGNMGVQAWHPVSDVLMAACGWTPLWIDRGAPHSLALAKAILSSLPVLGTALPNVLFENILHVLVWHDPASVGPVLKQWAQLSRARFQAVPLCSAEGITFTLQTALKVRAAVAEAMQQAEHAGGQEGTQTFKLSVPPYTPTPEALVQLHELTALGGLPAPSLVLHHPLQQPLGDLERTGQPGDLAEETTPSKGMWWGGGRACSYGLLQPTPPSTPLTGGRAPPPGIEAPFSLQQNSTCTVTETQEQFERNTAVLLDVLAEQLMQSGRHHTALRVVLQRASSMMLRSTEESQGDRAAAHGWRGSLDVASTAAMRPYSLLPESSDRYTFVFRIIEEQKLFDECLASLPQLLALDATATLKFCAAHKSSLPAVSVLAALLGSQSAAVLQDSAAATLRQLRECAPAVAAVQFRAVTAFALLQAGGADGWDSLQTSALRPWQPVLLILLTHFAPGQVMPMLQRCTQLPTERALLILRSSPCQLSAATGTADTESSETPISGRSAAAQGLWLEIALLLQRSGALESSLDLLIGTLHNVKQAVQFVQMVAQAPEVAPGGSSKRKGGAQRSGDGLTPPWKALLKQLKAAPAATASALWAQLLDELPSQGDHIHALATVTAIPSLNAIPQAKERLHRLLQAQSLTASMHRTVLSGAQEDQRQKHLDLAYLAAHGVFVPGEAVCSLSGLQLAAGMPSGDPSAQVHELLEDGTSADLRVAAALASSEALKRQQQRRSQHWAVPGGRGSNTGAAAGGSDAASDDSRSVGSAALGQRGMGPRRGSRSSSVDSMGGFGVDLGGATSAVPKSSAVITWGGQHYLMGALQRHSPAAAGALKPAGGPSLPLGLLKA